LVAGKRDTGFVWTDSSLTSPETYTYDVYGNMLAATRYTGTTYSFDVDTLTNHVSRGAYDAAGNLRQDDSSRTYTYDSENMIAQSTASTEGTSYYVYGPDDERVGVLASIRGTHPDSSSSMSLDDLLERMQMSWLFSDAFGAQLTVGPRK
jgi:YD repeat-containing protein